MGLLGLEFFESKTWFLLGVARPKAMIGGYEDSDRIWVFSTFRDGIT